MSVSIDVKTETTSDKQPKPLMLVIPLIIISFFLQFFLVSLRDYGGFDYFGYNLLLEGVIVQSLTFSIIFPTIHLMIASIWKSKRTSRSRRNIYFGWNLFAICSILIQFTLL